MNQRVRLCLGLTVFSIMLLASIFPLSYASTGLWRLLSPTEFTTTPDASVRGVFALNGGTGGINSGNVWAVGDAGLIFRWDGFSWKIFGPSPSGCQLNSVNFGGPLIPSSSNFASVSNTPGWIVGGVGPGSVAPCAAATALYYDGTGWSTQTNGLGVTPLTLNSVYTVTGSSSVEAYAVGTNNGVNGAFWHWFGAPGGGGAWSELLPNPALALGIVNGVYMTHGFNVGSADQGWAVGDGGNVFQWFGGSWNLFQTVNPSSCGPIPDLESVAMDSTTDGWAVGECGSIYHFTAGTWNGPVSPGTTINRLLSIVMLNSNEAWAVGEADPGSSNPTILHGTSLTGSPSWTRIALEKLPRAGDMFGVTFGVSGNNIWSVGAGGLFALCASGCGDSSFWGATSAPLVTDFNAVYMTGDNDGWVVGKALAAPGAAPTILHWDGVTLTRGSTTAGAKDLYGVWMTGSSEGWAVGGSGVGLPATVHYSGGTWTDVAPAACVNAGCILRGIYMSSSSNGWAVGTKGQIDHLTSSAGPWGLGSNLADATLDLYSVTCDPGNSNSCWAVGGNGGGADPPKIIHTTNGGIDGWAPAVLNPGGTANGVVLRSIFMKDNSHIWIVGSGSTILFSGNNGASWTANLIAGVVNPPLTLTGVYLDSNTDGWATGVDSLGFPVLVHYDGTGWSQDPLFANLIPNLGSLNGLFLTSSTNGLAVGTQITAVPTSLGLVFHLDPPSLYASTTASTPTTATSVVTTTSVVTVTSSSASTSTSSVASETSTSTVETSSSLVTSTMTSVSSSETSSSSSAGTTVTLTEQSSTTTPLVLPAIPGFPLESIMAGIVIGLAALVVVRRRRR